jgi:hypothetical protein
MKGNREKAEGKGAEGRNDLHYLVFSIIFEISAKVELR